MEVSEGDVVWVDFAAGVGSEVDKRRPAIVVQAFRPARLRTTVVVPLFSDPEYVRRPTAVRVPPDESGLRTVSFAVCHLMAAVDLERIDEYCGRLSATRLCAMRLVLADVLGIDAEGNAAAM